MIHKGSGYRPRLRHIAPLQSHYAFHDSISSGLLASLRVTAWAVIKPSREKHAQICPGRAPLVSNALLLPCFSLDNIVGNITRLMMLDIEDGEEAEELGGEFVDIVCITTSDTGGMNLDAGSSYNTVSTTFLDRAVNVAEHSRFSSRGCGE